MSNEFPYKEFEATLLWDTVDKAIQTLVDNDDIKETTNRMYIVGYICKALNDANLYDNVGNETK